MKLSRLLSLFVLGSAPVSLAVVSACSTTTIVDVPFDGGADSATADPDTGTLPEAAIVANVDAADAPVPDGKCHPTSAAGMPKATYVPPTGANQGLCTDVEIQQYVDCRNGKTSACAALTDGGTSCKSCIESDATAAAWGPIILGGGSLRLNEAGCGALANSDTTTMGCGQGLADYTACLQYTCGQQCIGSEYFACATEARSTECKPIVDGLKAKCTADVSACFAQMSDTTDSLSLRIIKRFCGSP
ncbi:MAG: hypothetical protein QOI41_3841 [Myxococcales bacterium]|nr:hypothetical protein [Myxococcales bacterium]